ncbi:SPP1 Gp6-like phage portal protein [Clostridium sporogenes]|uniref:phage portal protein n=1 Tax=Clostridium botulinum TaxID=1491 RepID=UPI000717A4D9|nr:phage portal protein [Clostridium botulinum]KRU29321.1 SPP1 Gp6-like phage portal protein [Clostridium sporogenes]KRU33409.1 SPP1 Gp6-like phage portal protein [Clostridium sporogenes]KRU33959.1 SPP1 Gp6-like phage portal protein [Clostridium sporogenes]KRU43393.1 SPP1 Gp6-like phage portal protein [Clostridium sporogenes]MBZ1330956.1 phage portal protein [Clostridium botulinum]
MIKIIDIDLLKKAYEEYVASKITYDKMYQYYKGNTDAMANYKMLTERSNNKTQVNYIKKFIKEEVSYSVGNDINYISKSGNENIVNDIDYYLDHWSEGHDSNLAKNMLIYSLAYELYYVDKEGQFSSKIIPPTQGYAAIDDFGNISFFMHIYKLKFDNTTYIDVYTDKEILYFNDKFEKIKEATNHIFGAVPVGLCELSEEGKDDTLFKDLKGLQDAYETNLSDISNEISDFRNAYMVLTGVAIAEEDIPKMKKLGVMQIKDKNGTASWLIKNINDTFIQNTLNTLEDKMYQLSSHINHNEKMQSNSSSLALRARLIALEEKCKLNQKSIADCIKNRLKFLFMYLKVIKNIEYDFRDIKIKFTPNIPQDDVMTAQVISQLGDKLSTETGLSLLSFIENPKNELNKLKNEAPKMSLDDMDFGADG